MRYLFLILLLTGCKGISTGDEKGDTYTNSGNVYTYYSEEQRENCIACSTTETLLEYGYDPAEWVCSTKCPLAEDGDGIDEDCDRQCIADRTEARQYASLQCYLAHECKGQLADIEEGNQVLE